MLVAATSAQQPSTTPLPTATRPLRVMKTFQFDSKLMARPMPYGIILPDDYDTDKNARFPVIYVLPGLGASYKVTTLSAGLDPAKYKDIQRAILVFVDSGGTGWYTDSATKPNDKYETYVVNELIPEVDKNLRTIAERRGRAVAGISMGGYGTLKFGIKYPKLFSLAVSWSGAVNITTLHDVKEYPGLDPGLLRDLRERLLIPIFGDGKDRTVINANDLTKLFTEYPADTVNDLPFFYLDCGTEDNAGLFRPNRELSELMINRKIPHEYREFPGDHGVIVPDRLTNLYRLSASIFAKQTEEQFVRVLEQQGFEQAVKLYKENRPRDTQQPIFSESF